MGCCSSSDDASTTKAGTEKFTKEKVNDPNYKGEQYDDKFRNGPVEKRHCTDSLCCLIFVAFIIGMGYCSIYGYNNNHIWEYLAPWDQYGNACGRDDAVKDYPYIFYPLSLGAFNFDGVCVKECTGTSGPIDCYVTSGACPTPTYTSTVYLKRFCLPKYSTSTNEGVDTRDSETELLKKIAENKLNQYMTDLYTAKYILLLAAGACLVLCIVYMILLRIFAGIIVWLSIFFVLGFFAALGYFFYNKYQDPDDELDDGDQTNYKWLAIFVWVVDGIFFLFILFMYHRIKLAIAVLKTASDFVRKTLQILLIPPVFFILVCTFIAYWICFAMFIFTTGEMSERDNSPFKKMTWTNETYYCWYYFLFGLIWVIVFLLSFAQFIIAVAAATWYFSCSSDDPGKGSVWKGVKWGLRYHLGSLAFGSLILAIIIFIRLIFEYIRKKMMDAPKISENKVIACCLRVVSCCLYCLNKFVKFLNRNAFIQMAITSENFCQSCRLAFCLILRNAVRFMALESISGAFIFVGKIILSGATAFLCYFMMDNDYLMGENEEVYSLVIPTIVAFIIAWIVASIFMAVYGLASNTIFQCFLVDEELAEKNQLGQGAHRPPLLNDLIPKIQQKDNVQNY